MLINASVATNYTSYLVKEKLTIDISVTDALQIYCTAVLLEKMFLNAALYSSIATFPILDNV